MVGQAGRGSGQLDIPPTVGLGGRVGRLVVGASRGGEDSSAYGRRHRNVYFFFQAALSLTALPFFCFHFQQAVTAKRL